MTQFAKVFDIYRTGNLQPANDPNSLRLFLDLVRLEGHPEDNSNRSPWNIEVIIEANRLNDQTLTILERHFRSKYFSPSTWVWLPKELKLVLTFGLMLFSFENRGTEWEFNLGLAGSATQEAYVGSGLTENGLLVRLSIDGKLEAYSYQNEYSAFGRTVSKNVAVGKLEHLPPASAKKVLVDVFTQGQRDVVVLSYLNEASIRSYFYAIDHSSESPVLEFQKEIVTPLSFKVDGLYYVMMTDFENEILSYGIGSKTIPMSTVQLNA